jgi:putative PIN family toxin of toxin-antitoxin system
MKLLLDSNVIIAAFATRGLCSDLFEICLEIHDIILSPQLLQEIATNLRKRIKLPVGVTNQTIDYLQQIAIIEPTTRPVDPKICSDPDGIKVLELAASAMPDCIVTGDPDLLVLKKFEGVPILSPRDFWKFLAKRRS